MKEQLISVESEFQRIDIIETYEYGRVLVLDGEMMITEKDEFIYHEMITHVPMAVHPNIRNVLVIGAGDGGTIRELTKYDTIEHIDMVEVDKEIVQVCREYMPFTACK
jgi:spermidine synthase